MHIHGKAMERNSPMACRNINGTEDLNMVDIWTLGGATLFK
jgi:hypothetical protein